MNDFFSQLYELFGSCYFGAFSDDLFNNGVYLSTGLAMLALAILGMAVFYLIKAQKPLTFRLPAWFITLITLGVINFIIAYSLSYSTLDGVFAQQNQDLPYGLGSFAGFGLINLMWSLVFCWIISVVIQLLFIKIHGNVPFRFRKSNK